MGGIRYDFGVCESRVKKVGYVSKFVVEIFIQNVLYMVYEFMNLNGVIVREVRDLDVYLNIVLIILGLDVIGSMGYILYELIKEGFLKLMGGIIQGGVLDLVFLFLGIGDYECDRFLFQVGQFEFGDEELDMWLIRIYIEGGGGGNVGESYFLVWYFVVFYIKIDVFEKRG